MNQKQINNFEELEAFIDDESISLENRLAVFTNALKEYDFRIMKIKFSDDCKAIENPDKALFEMRRIIAEIKAENQPIAGFIILYAKG